MDQIGKILKDEEGYLWCVRDNSENDGCLQDMVGADINHERVFLDIIRQFSLLKKKMFFIDIGAHVGYYSVRLSKYFHSIFSYEPSSYNNIVLNVNIDLNDCNNVYINHSAMNDKTGKMEMYERGSVSCSKDMLPMYDISLETVFGIEKVTSTTLDYEFQVILNNIAVVKIDTEGMELAVLKGGKDFLNKNKVILLIEHHESKIKGNRDKVISYLEDRGYFLIKKHITNNSKIFMTNIKGMK